ncbi:MAG: MGMT family protein, partial [Patescibacteria group bacterium]
MFEKIYMVVSRIPKGEVSTYKKVAELSGVKNPRLVGLALHRNKDPQHIPCHRVVNVRGKLARVYAFGGPRKQREILEKEGVSFLNKNTVNLKHSLYKWR